jgi:glutathione synthase/RimK-type ligase-like ATP-grasp enzyme
LPGSKAKRDAVTALDVAFVTWAEFPDGWVDDQPVAAALAARGVSSAFVCWDDPSVQWPAVGVAVIRSTWDYYRRLDAFLDWADHADAVTRLRNDAATIRWNAHKSYLLELAAAGVPTVPTTLVRKGELGTVPPGPVVVKPAVSVNADRTTRGATQADLDSLTAQDDALIQPYLASIEQGETSLICIDGEVSHAVHKVPAPGDFRTQEHHGAAVSAVEPTPAQVAVATAALAVPVTVPLYARVDLVGSDDGPLLMELELIEPTLHLSEGASTVDAFAAAIVRTLQ